MCNLFELSKLQLEGSLALEAMVLKVKGSSHDRTRLCAWSKHMRACENSIPLHPKVQALGNFQLDSCSSRTNLEKKFAFPEEKKLIKKKKHENWPYKFHLSNSAFRPCSLRLRGAIQNLFLYFFF